MVEKDIINDKNLIDHNKINIIDYLKKSSIDNKFIDDFYTFYDEGKIEFDFTINLELISNWLNVRKDVLKKLLLSNFIINRDYIQEKENGKKGRGINNTIHVLLTYNCSKLLCMISKSEKASLIRNYYIDLEKLIITYKDNIVNYLNNQLGIRTKNKKFKFNKSYNDIILYKNDRIKKNTITIQKDYMQWKKTNNLMYLKIKYLLTNFR